jgi:hypothetical protein
MAAAQSALAAALFAIELAKQPASGLKYVGTYQAGKAYNPGEFCTFDGGLWHCNRSTTTRPPGDCWVLAVRKGRDAKPVRHSAGEAGS